MKTITEPRITFSHDPADPYFYNVQLWHSYDGGKTFSYSGSGKFFKASEQEETASYCREHRSVRVFPVITSERQAAFEAAYTGGKEAPCICGIYGRACRQMDKAEGANRALCDGCPLADYAHRAEMMEYATT